MAISTFGATVVSTNNKGKYLAQARDFKISYVAHDNDSNGITPEEGILAAIGSCETIVTAGTFDRNQTPYNNFSLKEKLGNDGFHISFYLNNPNFFSEIKSDIKNTSPVYDNMVHAIPIEVSNQSEK